MPPKGPPPEDFDDNPPLTDQFFQRARPAAEVMGPAFMAKVARGPGRPKLDAPKAPITIRVDVKVAEALRASGRGWQTRLSAAIGELVAAGKI